MTLDGITVGDRTDLLGQVARFVATEISPLVEHPEHPIRPDQLAALTQQATRLGLLDEAADGFRLWGNRPGLVLFSVDALRKIAGADAGVAFHLHRLALLERLRDRLGVPRGTPGALSLQGFWGFGRQSLARLLAGRNLDEGDRTLLFDYFDLSRPRVVFGAATEALLAAGFDGSAITWQAASPGDLEIVRQPHAHGLDALPVATVRFSSAARTIRADTDLYAEAVFLDSIGMMAIAAGLVDSALRRASEYSGLRRQGGVLIKDHPAVQQMLGQLASGAHYASATLTQLAGLEPSRAALAELAAARAPYHPFCCRAVNQAMQVFGGIGYMRDVGVERLVRDANCLRVQNGTPVELELLVAAWRDQ